MWRLVASLVALAEVAALNPDQQRDKPPSLVEKEPSYTYPNTVSKLNTTNETENPLVSNLTYSNDSELVQLPRNQNDYDLKIENDTLQYKTNENRMEANKNVDETAEHVTDNVSVRNETEVSSEHEEFENTRRHFRKHRVKPAEGKKGLGNRPRPLKTVKINGLVDDPKSQVKHNVNEQENLDSLEKLEDKLSKQTLSLEPRLKLIKILSLNDTKKRQKLVHLWMQLYGNRVVKFLPNEVRGKVSNNYFIYFKPTSKAVKWLYNLWIQHKLDPENFITSKKNNDGNEMELNVQTNHKYDVRTKTDIDLSDINTAKQDIINNLKVAFGKWITQNPNLYQLPKRDRWLKFKNYLTQNREIDREFLETVIANILKEDEYNPEFEYTCLKKAETQYDGNLEEIKEQKLSIVNQRTGHKHKPIQVTAATITHDDNPSRAILDNIAINNDDTVDGRNSLAELESKFQFHRWLLQHPQARQLTPTQQIMIFMLDPRNPKISKQALEIILKHSEDRNTLFNQKTGHKHKPIQVTAATITHDDNPSRAILDNIAINNDDTVDGRNSLAELELKFQFHRWLLQHPKARQLTPTQQIMIFMLDPQIPKISKQALETILKHAEDRNTLSDKDDNNQNKILHVNPHAENLLTMKDYNNNDTNERSKVNVPE
ncbi:hypothetical protein JYU34_022074 [Plutella xylostella]|uniref:Uncharacterized protein n=1 Tax=Plutella xylostella TaxID=51655 RepID=A0ABQ7PQ60_PLUXY|nr:hypothetical protein JYU34_022074 [Plutella xylostella]